MNQFAKKLLPFSSLLFLVSLWTFLMPDTFLTLANFRNVLGIHRRLDRNHRRR